ncbi:MAG TPA: hypothetical protein VMF88_06135 [Bacteroidota bacterium]|nr:hypothetical protein [Bacteroidota bacterium]
MTTSRFVFTPADFRKLAKTLGVKGKARGNNVRFEVGNGVSKQKLAVEIYSGIMIGKERGNLVTVYTSNAHLQLHFCSGYVVSEMLGEVTFIGQRDGKVSGLIIEKEGGCSLYANVDRSLLSGDFTQLGPEVMLSGIALSLTESVLPEPKKKAATTRKR